MCTLVVTANSFSLNSFSAIHCLAFPDNVLNQAVASIATGNYVTVCSYLTQAAKTACLPSAYRFIGDWTIAYRGGQWEGKLGTEVGYFVALIATGSRCQ